MLLMATHKPYDVTWRGKRISLKAGQFTCGRKQLSAASGVQEMKIRRIISRFKTDQQIDQQISNRCSLFTILNWNEYQNVTNEQPGHRPATDHPPTTKQEQENIRLRKIIDLLSGVDKNQLQKGDEISLSKKSKKADPNAISLNKLEKGFDNVTSEHFVVWKGLAPTNYNMKDIERQLTRAALWLINRKTWRGNYENWLNDWMSHAKRGEGSL